MRVGGWCKKRKRYIVKEHIESSKDKLRNGSNQKVTAIHEVIKQTDGNDKRWGGIDL